MNTIGTSLGSAFTTAANAINTGVEQVTRVAQDVHDATTARPVEGVGNLAESMTDFKRAEHLVAAGSKVVQAADEQVGTLLNITA